MSRVCRSIGLLALALSLSVAPAAEAQPSGQPDHARKLFEEATVALRAGRFAEARDLLRESLALYPNTATAFNLGVALRGTGETAEALDIFEKLEAGEFGELSPAQRREAANLRRAVEEESGRIRVHIEGAPSARIHIDGEPVGEAEAGEAFEWLVSPGRRVVRGVGPEERRGEVTVDIERGKVTKVKLVLRPEGPATLVLSAERPEDRVAILGVAEGRGRIERELRPGVYTVRVTGEHGSRQEEVELDAGERKHLALDPPGPSLLTQPWFWVVAGAVVATGVGVGVWLGTRDDGFITDPVFGNTKTLVEF